MCGIAGIINVEAEREIPRPVIQAMTDTMLHRGPDGGDIFTDRQIGLGHRRLKIIDLSEAGRQPMSEESGRYVITFNGEIYNYREIRKELQQKGHRFSSDSDTEVLLKAYAEYGTTCLQKFIGMFAFAIYDSHSGHVLLARDRIGVKPLFYTRFDGRLLFASEIKALLAYPGFSCKANPAGVSSYLSYRYPVGHKTLFENIHALEPGHLMEIKGTGLSVRPYYQLPIIKEKENKGEVFYLEAIRQLLTSSVRYRMISDVPFGAYLSGGLDSSIVVALMSELGEEAVKTFTIGFGEEGYNEFSYAQMVAGRYKTEHREITLTPENYIDTMQRLISFKDAPLGVANEPALHVMSKELKKFITVVLSGEGADEIFGGYGRIFRSAYDYERMRHGIDGGSPLAGNLQLKYGDRVFRDELDHFLHLYQYIRWEEKKQFLSGDFMSSLDNDRENNEFFRNHFDRLEGLSLYDKYMWMFEKIHIVGLLERVDVTTMATSVEARVPFVDHRLVEMALSIPVEHKLKWKSEADRQASAILNTDQISEKHDMPKYILKKAFEDKLPSDVVWRKKMGFPVPVHQWFGKAFNTFAKDVLLSDQARQRGIYNHAYLEKALNREDLFAEHGFGLKIWMLINLELWFRRYISD